MKLPELSSVEWVTRHLGISNINMSAADVNHWLQLLHDDPVRFSEHAYMGFILRRALISEHVSYGNDEIKEFLKDFTFKLNQVKCHRQNCNPKLMFEIDKNKEFLLSGVEREVQ